MLANPVPVTLSTDDLAHVGQAKAKKLRPNTLKSYRQGWNAFERHADAMGVPAYPAHHTLVQSFLIAMDKEGRASRTIELRRDAIRHYHDTAADPRFHTTKANPEQNPANHPAVKETLAGLTANRHRPVGQAAPLTADLAQVVYHELEARLPHQTPFQFKRTLRVIALIRVARCLLARRMEVAALRWRDVTWKDDGTARIEITESKTEDGLRERDIGRKATRALVAVLRAAVPSDTAGPVGRLGWRGAVDIDPKGAADRARQMAAKVADRRIFGWNAENCATRIREACDFAGIVDPEGQKFTGHSCRVGGAVDMAANGATVYQIRAAGGWGPKSGAIVDEYVKRVRDTADAGTAKFLLDE